MAFDAPPSPHDEHTQKLLGVIDELEHNIRRFQNGELTPEQFRPLRLAMGVYAQLAHVKHMQRVKLPGGRMSADQVDALAEMTERWGRGLAHVTTRQDLQIHHLEISDAPELQRLLAQAGISTLGACMDTVRNVTASPYAGVLADEVFDVTPHAEALDRHFTFHPRNRKLPRKFKIGISGSPRDQVLARINDVGLFARVKDGVRGFRVYVAGGLGATPELAHPWLDFLAEDELLLACEAVLAVFDRDGERKNRKKNRLKFLLRKLGVEELLSRFDAELERLRSEQGEALRASFRGLVAGFAEPQRRPWRSPPSRSATPRSRAGSAPTARRNLRRATVS
jgi:sulfite reductase beta subunit-like hemoprotein